MTDQKIIIIIGRQFGSGGRLIAKKLADRFGCKFYDNELLNRAARESGFSEKVFEQNDENKGFLKSYFHLHLPLLNDSNFYNNEMSPENLFRFQSDAMRHAAEEGNCVFVGRCADYVLRDIKPTVNIFITADLNERIARVAQRRGISEEQARKLIEHKEEARASFYNYYSGKRWGDSSSYDLCVNSSLLGIDATADFIADFIKRRLDNINQ